MSVLYKLKASRAALLWTMANALDGVKARGVPKWMAYGVVAPAMLVILILLGLGIFVWGVVKAVFSFTIAMCLAIGWLAWDIPVCFGWMALEFARRISQKDAP